MIDKNGRRVAKKDLPPDGIPQHQLDAMTPAQKAAIAQAMKPLSTAKRSGTKVTGKAAAKKAATKATAKKARRSGAKKSRSGPGLANATPPAAE